jgi:serine/threonine protein kinase
MTDLPGFASLTECGHGGFSTIYCATECGTGQKVAIKSYATPSEISIHRELDHSFIAQYFGMISQSAIVMEYVQGQTLLDLVIEQNLLSEFAVQYIFSQIVSAVDYLHTKMQIVHRDLKFGNVMVSEGNVVKLIDFGLAFPANELATDPCGSLAYAAPEVFRGVPYGPAIDVWSIGVMLYAAVCGMYPFGCSDAAEIEAAVCGVEPEFPDFLSDDLSDLLRKMLTKDVKKRIDIEGVRSHRWFQTRYLSILMNQNAILIPELCTYPRGGKMDETVANELRNIDREAIGGRRDCDVMMRYRILRRAKIGSEIESGKFLDLVMWKMRNPEANDNRALL